MERTWIRLTIIIGSIALAMMFIFNIQNILITKDVINGITIYKLNPMNYLNNLSDTWTNWTPNFKEIIPTREFNLDIINNIALVFDWLYFPLNFILWILRILLFFVRGLLAIIGIQTSIQADGTLNPFIEIINWCINNLMIPYL